MTKKNIQLLIILIGCIAALGPFTIDMYLPGFPSMAEYFNTDENKIAYTLTSFFIGISIGQLIYGPLLDRFGRKRPLLVGLTIYVFASLGCAFAPNLISLIILRFIQASGVSVGMVAGNAIIRDSFETKDVAKMFSSILLVMGVAPIIAPTFGSYIVHHFSWQAIFIFLTIFSSLLITTLFFFLNAGKGPDKSVLLKVKPIAANYWNTLKNREFVLYTLAGSIAMAIMFAYISSIPFILMSIYGVSEATFGWLFGLNAFGFILGSQVNRLALKQFDLLPLTVVTSVISLVISLVFLIAAFFFQLPLVIFCGSLFSILFLLGFINPNSSALSLDKITENVGLAAALNGSLRMGAGAIVSACMGLLYNGTVYPMLIMICVLCFIAVVCLFLARGSLKSSYLTALFANS